MGNQITNGYCCQKSAGNDDTAEAYYDEKRKKIRFLNRAISNEVDVNEKYKRGKTLGRGAFGQVVECTNIYSNTQVAMKIVNKAKVQFNPIIAKLMEQELDVLAKTDHPHIVRHLELYEDDINFYTVSEIVRGGELCDYLKEKRFSERQAVNVIRQILLALNYMHQQNIVHRDIKLENILVTQGNTGA